jgi:predicted nuclease of restriction endonuclease-like RecB superfamily
MKPTKVIFKILNDEIIAIFPNELYNKRLYGKTLVNSYMHIGQHSACSKELINELKNATIKQYKELKTELEQIGYNLI